MKEAKLYTTAHVTHALISFNSIRQVSNVKHVHQTADIVQMVFVHGAIQDMQWILHKRITR